MHFKEYLEFMSWNKWRSFWFSVSMHIAILIIINFEGCIRWMLGVVYVLFMPGYILADTIFCEAKIRFADKLMLSFAFSVTITAVLGYLLSWLPCGINISSIIVSLFFVTFSATAVKALHLKLHPNFHQKQKSGSCKVTSTYYLALAFIVVTSTLIKLIPFKKAATLLDLDPYNHLMKVKAILNCGRTPSFDSLSQAPQGTLATYTITPLGFEFIVVALETITQAPLVELIGLLPALYGALLIIAIFSLCFEISKSAGAGLIAAFFTAFPTSWLAIYSVTMNPLAENVGLFLFTLTLLYLAGHIRKNRKTNLLCVIVLFGTIFYIHLFTVFYFVLSLAIYAFVSLIMNENVKKVVKSIAYTLVAGSFLALPVIFQIAPKSFQQGSIFSKTALDLAFASGSYLALLPQDLPRILSLPFLYLAIIALWVATAMIAVRTVWRILKREFDGYRRYLLPASWCLSLLLAGFAHLLEPLRNTLTAIPFSGPLLYAHRVVPYLALAFHVLIAVAINTFIRVLIGAFHNFFKFNRKNGLRRFIIALMMILVSLPVCIMSVAYTEELASQPTPQTYASFFEWAKERTGNTDVFIANNWDLAMWLRAIDNKPTVFSHVHQDLVSSDAERRILLHTLVFNGNDAFYDETLELLKVYNVSYVVVTSRPAYVDIINNRWVWEVKDLDNYIEGMDSKGYLKRVFSDENIWVYNVDKNVNMYVCRLNVTSWRAFIGNGWSSPYYLNGVLVRNATRGFVLSEWRFSDFFVSLDPTRMEYALEIGYYDVKAVNPVDLSTYTRNGFIKIGRLVLNGTCEFKSAKFTITRDQLYDYYEEKTGFQQYFVIGDSEIFNLPISYIIISGS
jgi:hypothetical protein